VQRVSAELLGLALTRKGAPSWIRERAAVGELARKERLRQVGGLAREALLLHTCERLEVYADVDDPDLAPWEATFARWLGLDVETVRSHLELRRGDEAARHLLRVASGLESRLVGETQIRGQLLQAWQEAREARLAGPVVSALARTALHAGRRVRSDTRLGRGRESLVTLVLGRLRRELGTLGGRRVAVAGTGALAAELVPALLAGGAEVRVASRSHARAVGFAERFGIAGTDLDGLTGALANADALVACTNGALPLPEASLAGRSTVLLDLGVPPSLEAGIEARTGSRLTRLVDLETTAPPAEVWAAERIVADEAIRFARWHRERVAAPLVAALLRTRPASSRPSPDERRALHLDILRLKTRAAA